jgi:glycosyltransferase involved in cell wall biosynthesis
MVSIITPCFNLSNYIFQTYQSLKDQTYTEWEWIIVDDGSTDDTLSIVEGWNDSRVKVVQAIHCGNLAVLRNIGARRALGEVLFFIDGDDLLVSDKIESQIDLFIKHPEIGWSHTNALTLIDETNQLLPRGMRKPPDAPVLNGEEMFESLTHGNYLYVSSIAIKRSVFEAVGGFDDRRKRCEDIDLYLRLSGCGYSVGYIAQPKLHYRVRNTGLYLSKEIEYLTANFEVFNQASAQFSFLGKKYQQNINYHFSRVYSKMGILFLKNNRRGAFRMFWRSIKSRFSLKSSAWFIVSALSPSMARIYIKRRQHFNLNRL